MHLGIEGLDFNHRGVCMLREEQDTTIAIEDRGEMVLVYVSRPATYLSEAAMEKALRTTHYRFTRAIPLGVCLPKGEIAFFAYLERSSITHQTVISSIEMLRHLLDTCMDRR